VSSEQRAIPTPTVAITEIEALREAARVMLGFQTLEDMQDLLNRQLVRRAILNLERALELTRERRQPDEFALATAIETELLKQAREAGHDLEALFNDPGHHVPPSAEITSLVERMWSEEK